MSIVAPSVPNGMGMYAGTVPFLPHDNLCDNSIAGVYTHLPTRFSATECESLCDLQRWHNTILQGNYAPLVFNGTGVALSGGTLGYIEGFISGAGLPIFLKSELNDPSKAAKYVLLESCDVGENAAVYPGGSVAGLDTSASTAIGDAVYASADGAFTFTPPSNPQIVGYVAVRDASSGQVNFLIQPAKGTYISEHTLSPVTILPAQTGTMFSAKDATTNIVFNLPTAKAGLTFKFLSNKNGVYTTTVTVPGGNYIQWAGNASPLGANLYTTQPYAILNMTAVSDTDWVGTTGQTDTWNTAG